MVPSFPCFINSCCLIKDEKTEGCDRSIDLQAFDTFILPPSMSVDETGLVPTEGELR